MHIFGLPKNRLTANQKILILFSLKLIIFSQLRFLVKESYILETACFAKKFSDID